MASWKDGAAYAPTERPDGFATPRTDPLPAGAPYSAATPGPMAPPRGFDVAQQAPLASIAAEPPVRRDPRESFAVSSMLLTVAPGVEAKRDPLQAFVTSSGSVDDLPPPTGQPLALPPPTGAPLVPGEMFAPPTGQPVRTSTVLSPQAKAERSLVWTAIGLLVLGFAFSPAAAFVLLVAGGMGMRTTRFTGQFGRYALIAGVTFLAWQLVTGSLGSANWLAGLVSLGFVFAYVVGVMRQT